MLLAGCARARAAPRVRRRGARFVPQRARVPAQGSVRSAPLCAARTLNVVGQSPCHSGTSTQEQPVSRGRRKGGLKSAPKLQGPVRRLCQLAARGMKRLISLTAHGSLGVCVGSCSLFLPRARVHSAGTPCAKWASRARRPGAARSGARVRARNNPPQRPAAIWAACPRDARACFCLSFCLSSFPPPSSQMGRLSPRSQRPRAAHWRCTRLQHTGIGFAIRLPVGAPTPSCRAATNLMLSRDCVLSRNTFGLLNRLLG